MEALTFETSTVSTADNGQKPTVEASVLDDKVILDLAKRRLNAKRNITGQILDFCLILVCVFMFICLYDIDDRAILAFFFCSFWSIRLLIRIVKFAKPSFKDGIAAYFRDRQERKIESEYNRLKKMSTESVLSELNK